MIEHNIVNPPTVSIILRISKKLFFYKSLPWNYILNQVMCASLLTFHLYWLCSGYVEVIVNGFTAFMPLLFKNTAKNSLTLTVGSYFMIVIHPFPPFSSCGDHILFSEYICHSSFWTQNWRNSYLWDGVLKYTHADVSIFSANNQKIQSGFCLANELGFGFVLHSFQVHTSLCVVPTYPPTPSDI